MSIAVGQCRIDRTTAWSDRDTGTALRVSAAPLQSFGQSDSDWGGYNTRSR